MVRFYNGHTAKIAVWHEPLTEIAPNGGFVDIEDAAAIKAIRASYLFKAGLVSESGPAAPPAPVAAPEAMEPRALATLDPKAAVGMIGTMTDLEALKAVYDADTRVEVRIAAQQRAEWVAANAGKPPVE